MSDTEIIEWLEKNPLSITAIKVLKHWGYKIWWQTVAGDFDTLREAVEDCNKRYPKNLKIKLLKDNL